MKIHALDACPACGARQSRDFRFGAQRLCRCAACETIYAADYADPSEVYVDGYLCAETEFGIDISHPRFQRYLAGVGAERARLIERITGARGRLLDVGCGSGEFAAAARGHGFDVQAVEPESTGAEIARKRGLDVREAMLEDAGLPERSYDVVSAFHVLEHLPDSRAFLSGLARFAKPGGHVVIEVPNFGSVLRRRSGVDWVHLRPLEHLIYHTPETLERSFLRSGLEPVAVRTRTWLSPPQSLDDALADLARPRLGPARTLLARREEVDGNAVLVPRPIGWALLRALGAAYDFLRGGTVVLGVARVPQAPA
jgi:SAM-dependent methyltransferase